MQVFWHIGAPKSGTTYLQELLWNNREALRDSGVLYPGPEWHDHVYAALSLRNVTMKGHVNPDVPGSWARLVAHIRDWDGPAAVIDQELFSPAGPKQIARGMAMLDFADVHVVYTLRDMARVLPAAWQEWAKNREVESFHEYLGLVREAVDVLPDLSSAGRVARLFWGLHDTEAILTRWSATLPPERVHVITVPQSGAPPNLLWDRFASVIGLDGRHRELAGASANTSLAAAEAAVLHRFNNAVGGEQYPWPVYDYFVKHRLAPELATRKGPAITLPPEYYEWAVEWSRRDAEFVGESGYHVVGDVDELLAAPQRSGVEPDSADPAEVADAAIAGMAVLARQLADESAMLATTRTDLEAARRALSGQREDTRIRRLRRRAREAAERHERLRPFLQAYWALRERLRRFSGTA